MFKDNTVFVIGAGASREFGFPVGGDLMKTIKDKSSVKLTRNQPIGPNDEDLRMWLAQKYPKDDERLERNKALIEINRAIDSAGSIDEFISRNSHDPYIAEMGKVQIAYAISKAEASTAC